jgi:glycosyltransferase involved in cell wall biosynthesis
VSARIEWSSVARERLRDLYAGADALLFPVQWEEPWGLVPLEAMAVGRPVVATGTGGSAEYLRHEENCLLYEPRDSPEALAAAVRRLAGDEPLRGRLTAAGHRTAERFTQEAYNEAIAAALEREVAGARRGNA